MMRSRVTTLALAATLLVALTGCSPAVPAPSALDRPAAPDDSLPSSMVESLKVEQDLVADVDTSRLIGTWSGVDVYLMRSNTADLYCSLLYLNDESWTSSCSGLEASSTLQDIAEVRVHAAGARLEEGWVQLDENVSVRKPK